MSTEETILLIDLGSMFHRYWGATKSQFQTYAGTIHKVETMAEEYKATIICADSLRNWRNDHVDNYKAQREKKPEEFLLTLASVKEKLSELEFPVVECDTFEADDVIATLVKQSFDPIHVMSEDKDLVQLVSDAVTQLTNYGTINPAVCWRKFGVRPDQMRDFLAIAGDTADNVQGCPGVGIDKAAKLLQRFGTIEGIKAASPAELKKVPGVGNSVIEKISAWDPSLARLLVSLKTDCPASLDEQLRMCGVAA